VVAHENLGRWSTGVRSKGIQPSTPPSHQSPTAFFIPSLLVVSISSTEHIIERACRAAYTCAYCCAFANIGMRRCTNSRSPCAANRRACQCCATARHYHQKQKTEIPSSSIIFLFHEVSPPLQLRRKFRSRWITDVEKCVQRDVFSAAWLRWEAVPKLVQ